MIDALPLFQFIEALPYLSEVDLSQAHVKQGLLQAFQQHRALQALNVSGCHILDSSSLYSLAGLEDLPGLAFLDITCSSIYLGDPCLSRLPALTHLRVEVRNGPFEQSLSKLTSLCELVLFPHDVLMTEGMCTELLQLPHLRNLEVVSNSYARKWLDLSLTSRLLMHPTLAQLRWSLLRKDLFQSYASTNSVRVLTHVGWVMVAFERRQIFAAYANICTKVDLTDFVTSTAEDNMWLNVVYTRAGQ